MTKISRRVFAAGLLTATCANAGLTRTLGPRSVPIVNPLIRRRADPFITREAGGGYLFTASVPEYDRVILRRSATIGGLSTASETVIWRRPATGPMAGNIWAPEIHFFNARWHIYVAAGDGDAPFHIRTYVLRCDGDDPTEDRWSVMGQLKTQWDTFTLDCTSFEHRGQRYLCWAQAEPGIDTNSNLYLAPLDTPLTLAANPVRLVVPTLPWEVRGYKVAEGPAMLARNGHLFLTYSASATDANYCLGMLSARDDVDIMDSKAWKKSPTPVFSSAPDRSVFGPGHNSFTVDDRGRDTLVYHARDYRKITGDPLYDPNRHTRMQLIRYGKDGTPDFGLPVANGVLP